MKNDDKVAASIQSLLYKAVLSVLGRLRDLFDTLDRGDVPSFRALMDSVTKTTPTLQQTMEVEFMNSIPFVESARGKNSGKVLQDP